MAYDSFKIRELMRKQGRTARELSSLIAYDEATISRFLNDRQPITDRFAVRVSDALGVPLEWLRAEKEVAA